MYSVKLDEQNYFTGSYAKVGSIPGGISVYNLPADMSKATCYKYGKYTKPEIVNEPILDPETGLIVVDEEGNPTYKQKEVQVEIIGWIYDEEKFLTMQNEKEVERIRQEREEAFKIIDKYQLQLVYNNLTLEQQEQLKSYRQAWLDAPETKSIPNEEVWMR